MTRNLSQGRTRVRPEPLNGIDGVSENLDLIYEVPEGGEGGEEFTNAPDPLAETLLGVLERAGDAPA